MIEEKPDYRIVDWEKLRHFTKILARKIRESKYEPNIIVGILKGGWALARLLCDYINGKDMISLAAKQWELHEQASPNLFNKNLLGKKVLMVYDVIDEKSMEKSIRYLASSKPDSIKTLSLFCFRGDIKPDYCAEEISDELVIFPWNFMNSTRKIIYNLNKIGEIDVKSIRSRLKRSLNITLEEEVIDEILRNREKL